MVSTPPNKSFNLFNHKHTHATALSHQIPHPSLGENVFSKNTFHRGFRNPVHSEPFSLVQLASQLVGDRHSLQIQHPLRLQVLRGKDKHSHVSQLPRLDDGNEQLTPVVPPAIQLDVSLFHALAGCLQCAGRIAIEGNEGRRSLLVPIEVLGDGADGDAVPVSHEVSVFVAGFDALARDIRSLREIIVDVIQLEVLVAYRVELVAREVPHVSFDTVRWWLRLDRGRCWQEMFEPARTPVLVRAVLLLLLWFLWSSS